MKNALVLTFFLLCMQVTNAQDKIFLHNDSIISGKIIYTDTSKVKLHMQLTPEGPDSIFYKNDIIKIKYESGPVVFYKNSSYESSFGISFSSFNNKSTENNYESSSQYPGINFQLRGAIIGFKIFIGYGTVNKTKTFSTSTISPSGGFVDSTYTESKSVINFNYSLRINIASNRNVNPFVAPSVIVMENYQIYLIGLGAQFKISKQLFFEIEFAKGFWTENDNYDSSKGNKSNYLNFGINRIIKSKYKNRKS
jgi:hypothetical protein